RNQRQVRTHPGAGGAQGHRRAQTGGGEEARLGTQYPHAQAQGARDRRLSRVFGHAGATAEENKRTLKSSASSAVATFEPAARLKGTGRTPAGGGRGAGGRR